MRDGCSLNCHYTTTLCGCAGGAEGRGGEAWWQPVSGSDTCSPLPTPSSLQLLRFLLPQPLPALSVFCCLCSPPPSSAVWRRSSSQQAGEQREGPVQMFLHAGKEEGFVRTRKQTLTITVTSPDCFSATKAAV